MSSSPHLWLALSPHGFGHAAMTAPVVAEIRRRQPDLRLTIQTSVDLTFLRSRYADFTLVPTIADFGFRMVSATGIDFEASAAGYRALMARYDQEVDANATWLRQDRPDLVLSNVAFVPLAAAARAGVPALAMSSLNWADMYAHYFGHLPEAGATLERLHAAYGQAELFLRCTPSQHMTVAHQHPIGPLAQIGHDHKAEVKARLGRSGRVGLIAFGGINHDLDLNLWPRLEGWRWLVTQAGPQRPDMIPFAELGLSFSDLVASVDVVVTKPGYGTFTEAAMVGTPVLYTERPDWPETPHLDHWLAAHTRCVATTPAAFLDGRLPDLLRKLFSLPDQPVARPDGVREAAEIVVKRLLRRY